MKEIKSTISHLVMLEFDNTAVKKYFLESVVNPENPENQEIQDFLETGRNPENPGNPGFSGYRG